MYYTKTETFERDNNTVSVIYLCITDKQGNELKIGYVDKYGRVHFYTL